MSDLRPTRPMKLRLPLTADHAWSVDEAAYHLGVSPSTVRYLEKKGDLPSLPQIGSRVRFDPKIVQAFSAGWRPPPGWRRQAPPPQIIPIDDARRV